MDCNPYLALAASLACGYLGMKDKLQPARRGGGRGLPPAAGAAARPAGGARPVRGTPEVTDVLGEEFCALYKAIKRDEVETFLQVISPWERDHLLLNV